MLRLDVGTMGFSAAALSLAAALVISGFGGLRHESGRWTYFSSSAAFYGLGMIAILLRGALPPIPAILGGNLLVMASALAFHAGICQLVRRPPLPWAYALLTLVYLGAESYYLLVEDSINARIAVISLLRVPIFAHAALMIRASRRVSAAEEIGLLELVAALWAVLLVPRSIGTVFVEGPIHDFNAMVGTQALYFAASGLGNVLIAVGLLRKMVAEKTAALETQMAFQEALFDTLPVPVFARDINGVFVGCNRAYERYFGVAKDHLIGRTAAQVMRDDVAAECMASDRRVLASRHPSTYEAKVIRAEGAERQVVIDKACYSDAEGRLAGVVASVADITEMTRVTADLRSILDNMTDVFFRADAHGLLLMVSKSATAVLGYSAEEMLGTGAATYYVDAARPRALFAALEASGGAVNDFEICLRHKNGSPVWVSVSARFYHDSHGKRAGTEGSLRPINERKRAEITLVESQSLVRAMLNASADAIMLLLPDGTLLGVNDVMGARFGRQAGDLVGACLWDLFPPEVSKDRRDAVRTVMDSGQPLHTYDRRGALYFHNSIYPVLGPTGIPEKLAVYSRDITEQKVAEAKIVDYIQEIERSNAELEQFAYVASHDLREPLRMVSSYLSLLERRYGDRLDDNAREFLFFARDGAQRMDRLVLDLLDFSRIQRRGNPLVAMEAMEAIRLAIHHLDPAIADASATVVVDEVPPLPIVIGDRDQIARLFQNLVGNALKYRAKDRPPEIRVSMCCREGEWEFHVVDNGIGIDPQYFERIFGIFQRLHTRDKYEGTGIGLAICKKIVERHGGRIWVTSTPGQGSDFAFTLPDGSGAFPH